MATNCAICILYSVEWYHVFHIMARSTVISLCHILARSTIILLYHILVKSVVIPYDIILARSAVISLFQILVRNAIILVCHILWSSVIISLPYIIAKNHTCMSHGWKRCYHCCISLCQKEWCNFTYCWNECYCLFISHIRMNGIVFKSNILYS